MILKEAKTDWLGSKPVFYNEKTGKISHLISDVIDYENLEFHPEGLHNYLSYGYSVFGQTPIQNVKFLRYASTIKNVDGKLVIQEQEDPCDELMGRVTKPEDVLMAIQEAVREWGG